MAVGAKNSTQFDKIGAINGVPEVKIGSLGPVDFLSISGPPPPPDAISVNPEYYVFTTSGGLKEVATVTCSEAGIPSTFTASVTSDPQSIIEELVTTGGNSGDTIWVTVITNSTYHSACASATITLTCGDASCELIIYQDGYVGECEF